MHALVGPVLTTVELWPREGDCTLCGALTPLGLCLPMYEGEVLSDDYEGEWAGMLVCAVCYATYRPNAAPHLRGEAPAEPRKSGGDCCAKD